MTHNTITLRALEPEDLELLYTIENDRALWWLGTQTAPYSRYRLRDYIASSENDIYKDEQVRYVIEHEGQAVGVVDLFSFSARNSRAELGIALLRSAQGKGLARMAIAEILGYARDILNLHQVYAIVPESNSASLRMLSDCHFVRTGELKDWIFSGHEYENGVIMQFFL